MERADSVVSAGKLGSLPVEPAELLKEGSQAASPKAYEEAEAVELSGVAAIDQVRAMLSDNALMKTLSREEREAVHNFEEDIKTPEEAEVHAAEGGVQHEVGGVSDEEEGVEEAAHDVLAGKAVSGKSRELQSQALQETDDAEGRQEVLSDATGDEGAALPAGQGPKVDASSCQQETLMLFDEKDEPQEAWAADRGTGSEEEAHLPSGEEGGPGEVVESIKPTAVEDTVLPHKVSCAASPY